MRFLEKSLGSSLIEIMLGLVIGMLIAFMVANTTTVFQAFSKTSTGSNNALVNGTTAMFALEHDIKVAGLGFIANQAIACSAFNVGLPGMAALTGGGVAPVLLTQTGIEPDTLSMVYAGSVLAATPTLIIGSATNSVTLNYMSNDLQIGNYALIETIGSVNPCTLVRVTGIVNAALNTTVQYNAGTAAVVVDPTNSVLVNLGTLSWPVWSIQNNTLIATDRLTGLTTTVANNIVQLKTQYGVTNGVSGVIQNWVDPIGIWADPDLPHLEMIRGVRVALLARSSQKEKPTGGSVTCNTTTNPPIPWTGATAFDLTADPNWRCYRYHVIETIIPLKNILFGGVV